ncbi:MAG: wax ester/triacylglycerol synthase family O-acyltransferase [Candidatus Binatia bacterium]|jgi:diacylglycerol O-acyltransferase / wax synthase
MDAQHLDRLSIADAAFLWEEDRGTHAPIGWVMIADGPPPAYADLLKHVKARLHLVPRYRQKLAFPPLQLALPLWIDDPRFNLEYHVRHAALPAPGSWDQLRALVGRIFSQGLDRSKPLWELWLVQGLRDRRFAIINKAHRAVVDGIAGVDVSTVFFDTSPHPAPVPAEQRPWLPRPEPSPAELVTAGIRDLVAGPVDAVRQAWRKLDDAEATIATVREVVQGLRELGAAYMRPPSRTPLNVPLGPHRRVYWTRCRAADFKQIRDSFGGTINDVYLAVVSGALAAWLGRRGIRLRRLQVRAELRISLRNPSAGGSRIVSYLVPLPVGASEPLQRLQLVRRLLDEVKRPRQTRGAGAIAALQEFTPPALLARLSPLIFSSRLFNLIAAYVPGPHFPLYLLGHKVTQVGPIGFLVERCALMVTLVSYNRMLEFGLLADADAVPDLDDLGRDVDDAIAELIAAARKEKHQKLTRKSPRRGAHA